MSESNRIEYIDALRGLTMLMVVMHHIVTYNYQGIYVFSWGQSFTIVQNPLFFFISGFFLYKDSECWNSRFAVNFLKKKFRVVLIPTLLFLTIYAYTGGWTLQGVIDSKWKAEYWFTYVLCIFYFIYAVLSVLMNTFRLRGGQKVCLLLLFGVCLTLMESLKMNAIVENHPFLKVLSLSEWKYFIFFVFGTVVKKYFNRFQALLDNDSFMAAILVTFIATLVLFQQMQFGIVGIKLKFVGYGVMGIIILFAYFRKHSSLFSCETKVGKLFIYVGKRTLDIYLLHFFFLTVHWRCIGQFFTDHPNSTVEFFITLIFALMVISLSLLMSSILRTSPTLASWLFGERA